MNVEITRINHTGEGVGTLDHKIVFIPKTIPGDIVKPKNLEDHGKYLTAIVDSYIETSSISVIPPCPYYQECGGCQLMRLPYPEQLTYKKEKIKDIFTKYANLKVDPEIIPSPQTLSYRNKITLQIKNGKIGLFQTESNDLVPIRTCTLVPQKINDLIPLIQDKINLQKGKQIIIKIFQHQIMVQFIGEYNPDMMKEVLKDKVASLYLNNTLIYGKKTLEEQLENYLYAISPNSFFQVNKEQTINLYNKVKEYLGTPHQHILDLYCGTASIGIYVSQNANHITGIELNPSSVMNAKQNIQKNNLKNIEVFQGDVGTLLDTKNTYDAIIVDPPRSGLDKKTITGILKIKSPQLIYISCNPITLARDLKRLGELYQLEEITAFDLFPNTYHVECVCHLSKRKREGNV